MESELYQQIESVKSTSYLVRVTKWRPYKHKQALSSTTSRRRALISKFAGTLRAVSLPHARPVLPCNAEIERLGGFLFGNGSLMTLEEVFCSGQMV